MPQGNCTFVSARTGAHLAQPPQLILETHNQGRPSSQLTPSSLVSVCLQNPSRPIHAHGTLLLHSILTMGDLMEFELSNGPSNSTDSMQPPTKRRKRKAPTLRDSDWEPIKERFTELYTAGVSQKDLKKCMEIEFNFFAT
jgi:hypothetical protein